MKGGLYELPNSALGYALICCWSDHSYIELRSIELRSIELHFAAASQQLND